MSDKDNGGPAFPFPVLHGKGAPEGISIRDYFAAKAMQGQLSYGRCRDMNPKSIAEYAYQYADAMLKERDK